MRAAEPVWPEWKNDYKKFIQFQAYTWEAQAALDDAVRSASPFALLRLETDARPDEISILQFQKNFKEKK